MRERNPKRARIVCDGDWGVSEGLIYENWVEKEFDINSVLSTSGIQTTFGLDFGYAVSFNAFIAVAVDLTTRTLWVWDEMYQKGMTNIDITKKIIEMGYGKEHIIADSAEPKSIYEIQSGFNIQVDHNGVMMFERISLPNIRPAMKGPDSVKNGIQRLQSFQMIIHPRCVNTIMELCNYSYDVDQEGAFTDKPAKEWDHLMDALRMAMEKFFVRGKGRVVEAKGREPYEGPFRAPREDPGEPRKCRRVVSTL